MESIEFEVGQKYENRKGEYEVLSINDKDMRIRWENGEEIETTVTMQRQIIDRMQREIEWAKAEEEKKKEKNTEKKKKGLYKKQKIFLIQI